MNTSRPYDQQQQQQQFGYGNRSSSAVSLVSQKLNGTQGPSMSTPTAAPATSYVPMGRPLPRTPGSQQQQQQQQQQQFLDPSIPTSTGLGSGLQNSASYHNFGNSANHNGPYSNNGFSKSGTMATGGTNRTSIHASQPSISSLASSASSHNVHISTTSTPSTNTASLNSANNNNNNSISSGLVGGNSKGHPTWGFSAGVNPAAGSTYSAAGTGDRRSLQFGQQQQGPKLTSEEESSYYTALTRPISPTMVMNYIPPPTGSSESDNGSISEASSGSAGHPLPPPPQVTSATTTATTATSFGPHSATVALSSSLNALGTASHPASKPGARSSYIQPLASSPGSATSAVMGSSQPIYSSAATIGPEDPASNSARMARRGPLMGQENGNYGDGTRSRRESAAYNDALDSPASLSGQQYRPSPGRQQPFSPGSQRADGMGPISPTSLGSGMMQQVAKEGWLWRRGNLLTWKRCYAIGRFRGDSHPGLLTLFKDNEHLSPIKTIEMAECLEVQVKGQDAKATGRFEFKVVTRKEETWFATDTMSERTGWIDALNSLMSRAVGASLMKLEAKLNNIRHRNNSLDYSHNVVTSSGSMEDHFQAREQQLSQREQELERKRVESLLVQLEAWRAAAKVTVNQHYTVRDQLLERVMKTARTVQELLERAKIHLDTGSDQITEVVNSHLECLKVHASESVTNATSYKMVKSILVGLTVNLDTRSSEIKRVLLVLDQLISATKVSGARSTSTSSPPSPMLSASPAGAKDRRLSMGPPVAPSSTASAGITMYLVQVRDKYKETLDILEDHSKRLKRILERADINNPENARRFHDEAKETLKGLLRMPSYVFVPCLPDQPLPGVADTFYREDLVVIHQKSREMLRKGQPLSDMASLAVASTDEAESRPDEPPADTTEKAPGAEESTSLSAESPTKASATSIDTAPTLSLSLPPSLSSFLLPETTKNTTVSTAGMTQKFRDTMLPEFDHLSIKQEESLQSMTTLLNQVSSVLVSKLTEIKDATAGQRQEFEDLKDEIIDVMQLSATVPSAHQKDISALSEIRSKLAEITDQLNKVQEGQNQQGVYAAGGNGPYRRVGPPGNNNGSSATATGYSLLQRSASTMVHSSYGGARSLFHTVEGGGSRSQLQRGNSTSTNRLHLPSSTSVAGLGSLASGGQAASGRHPKIAGMARMFEDGENSFESGTAAEYDMDPRQYDLQNQMVVSKLDQLLLLLEFVNTAQCRMMAYQDLEYDRTKSGESNVDDGRMMAVQEHMEQMDKKMNLQMGLLKRLVTLQGSAEPNASENLSSAEGDQRVQEIKDSVEDDKDTSSILSANAVDRTSTPFDLSLVEVLNRLDLQVIPFVKDQSGRVQELSDQLSEMKRQLDEQQRRQDLQLQQASSPPRTRISTTPNLGRSNSKDGAAPFMRSRSPSQPLIQHQSTTAALTSPMEIESPAMWRAALKPSNSTGSASAAFRDRSSTATSSSPPSNSSSQSNLADAQYGVLVTKTSDRLAEMLDSMDAKMGQMIDEQLQRYDKGNKELLAKVYELLDGDDIEDQQGSTAVEHKKRHIDATAIVSGSGSSSAEPTSIIRSDLVPLTEKLEGIEQKLTEHSNQDTKELLERILKGQEDLSAKVEKSSHERSTNESSGRPVAEGQSQDSASDSAAAAAAQQDLLDSMDNLKSLIREEADRSESSLNEQRDEILERMNHVLSSIQESQADVGSRDAAVRDELQEMRDWIVRHSSMQTENLREIVFAATNGSGVSANAAVSLPKDDSEGTAVSRQDRGEYTDLDILDDLERDPVTRRSSSYHYRGPSDQFQSLSKPGVNANEIQDLIKDQLDMFTKIQMATFSELADNVSGMEKMLRDMSRMMGVRRGGTILRKKEAEEGRAILTQEVKETIEEVITRMNPSASTGPPTGSGPAPAPAPAPTLPPPASAAGSTPQKGITPGSSVDNSDSSESGAKNGATRDSGIFRYLYQPRRPAAPTPPAALPTPAATFPNAKDGITVNTSLANTAVPGHRSPRTPLSPASECTEEDSASTQVNMDVYHDQMEQLYRRKARVEIEVEDLQSEKQSLQRERDELKAQVEQLRREKQEMLLSLSRGGSGAKEEATSPMHSQTSLLENALSDRVAMLLQETMQLQVLKKQLETNVATAGKDGI